MRQQINILVLFLISISTQNYSGVAVSCDLVVVENVKDLLVPIIQNVLPKIEFPEISESGFTIKNTKIESDTIESEGVTISLQESDNSVQVGLNDMAIKIKGDFKYKWFIISVSGDFTATIKQGGAAIQMGLPLSTQTCSNNKNVLAVSVSPFSLTVDTKKIDIDIGGSIMADIASLFVDLFQSSIIKSIVKEINSSMPSLLSTDINQALLETEGLLQLGQYGLALDISLPTNVVLTSSQAQFYLNGTFFNQTEEIPSTEIADLIINKQTTESVQVDVSTYTTDSLLLTLHTHQKLQVSIDNNTIPELTTTLLDPIIPGLIERYGDNVGMQLDISSATPPKTVMNIDEIGATFDMNVNFNIVGNETAVIFTFDNINALLNLTYSNFTFYPYVNQIKFGKIEYSDSKVGKLDTLGIKEFLNIAIKFALPLINKKLAEGIEIPHDFNKTISIQDAAFNLYDGYMSVLLSPEFL